MKFSISINNLQLRSCGKHLLQDGEHNTAEIVQWQENNSSCFTVAYWDVKEHTEPSLSFVADRLSDCNPKHFWYLAKQGQRLLTEKNGECELLK